MPSEEPLRPYNRRPKSLAKLKDIENYKKHPNCKNMFCFVYDPEGRIRNPKGIEKDLTRETDGIRVFTYIYPR